MWVLRFPLRRSLCCKIIGGLGVNSESRPKLQGPPLMRDGIAAHARSLQIKNTPDGKARGAVVECEMCGEL